jgi:type IV pilus assembly protein PilO
MTVEDSTPVQDEGFKTQIPALNRFRTLLTPTVGGMLIAFLGGGLAFYAVISYVKPLWQEKQELEQPILDKQRQISNQRKAVQQQMSEVEKNLATAKRQKTDLLSLYVNEDELNKLQTELNRIAKSRPGTVVTFKPTTPAPELVTDKLLGQSISGKVRRQVYKIEISGKFADTYLVLMALENLHPSLVFKVFKTNFEDRKGILKSNDGGRSVTFDWKASDEIKTTFDMIILLPVS